MLRLFLNQIFHGHPISFISRKLCKPQFESGLLNFLIMLLNMLDKVWGKFWTVQSLLDRVLNFLSCYRGYFMGCLGTFNFHHNF